LEFGEEDAPSKSRSVKKLSRAFRARNCGEFSAKPVRFSAEIPIEIVFFR